MKLSHKLAITLVSTCSLLFGHYALALDTDRDQPIRVQADSATLDDKTGQTIYRGNVIIQQGSLELTGSQISMTRDSDGVETMTAVGQPAHFKQQIQDSDAYTEAFGQRITYSISAEVLEAKTDARVINDRDTFTGHIITYDLKNKLVNAQGNSSTSNGRIEMIIQPRSNNEPAK